ncbi:MAG: ankyrin repeat domain-containing protein [Bacteroidota bacterium]
MPLNLKSLLLILFTVFTANTMAQSYDESLLESAAAGDDKGVVFALSKGADINVATAEGVTALMYASQYGYIDIVKILVFNNADLEIRANDSCTALSIAAKNNQIECAEHLIREGAQVDTKDKDGVTPLMFACGYGLTIMSDLLLYYDADVNARTNDSSSALHAAAYFGFPDIVSLLLNKDANPNLQDKEGVTPFILAAQQGYVDIMKLLQKKNARVTHIAKDGYNALTAAAIDGKKPVVDYLISTENKWSLKGFPKMNPIRVALLENHLSAANMFRKHNLKGGWKPLISTLTIMPLSFKMNNKDFMYGLGVGFIEMNYRTALDFSYYLRPWRNRQLVTDTGGYLYQYRESRHEWTATLVKNFYFRPNDYEPGWGIFAGAGFLYTGGKYKAVKVRPDPVMKIYPTAGFMYDFYDGVFQIGYEFADRNIYNMPPHRFFISLKACSFLLFNYVQPKKIRWL